MAARKWQNPHSRAHNLSTAPKLTQVPQDYSGMESWQWDGLCHAQEVSPEQKVTCNKQEETLWLQGVKFGELIAANLNSQAVYRL